MPRKQVITSRISGRGNIVGLVCLCVSDYLSVCQCRGRYIFSFGRQMGLCAKKYKHHD